MAQQLPHVAVATVLVLGTNLVPGDADAQLYARQRAKISGSLINERLGNDVAIDSGYVAVGAPNALNVSAEEEAGRVFVFYQSGSSWVPSAGIFQGLASEQFGWAVDIDGTYMVGTSIDSTAGPTTTGRARVFLRTGDAHTWDAGVDLAPGIPADAIAFGNAVAMDGDYIIVGSFGNGGAGNELSGAAYVFMRTGVNTWDSGAVLVSPNPVAGGRFGYNVDISGDYVIVGAPMEGSNGNAYVFMRTGANTWDSGTTLSAAAVMSGDGFGTSVAISGDTAVVGASPSEFNNMSAGEIYAFQRTSGNTWGSGVPLTVEGDTDGIGRAVALSGDLLIAGAQYANYSGDEAGTANSIRLNDPAGFTWDDGRQFAAEDFSSDSNFGFEVDVDGSFMVVGAYADDENNPDAGAAYVFEMAPPSIQPNVASIDFGDVELGGEGRVTLTYTNVEGTSETLYFLTFLGFDFTLEAATSSPCDLMNPTVLAPGASCNVDVVFAPLFEGTVQDTLLATWSTTLPDLMTEVMGTAVLPAMDGGPADGGPMDGGAMDGGMMGDAAGPGDTTVPGDTFAAGDSADAGDTDAGSPKKGCASAPAAAWWALALLCVARLRRRRG